jgi:hypothetical protein
MIFLSNVVGVANRCAGGNGPFLSKTAGFSTLVRNELRAAHSSLDPPPVKGRIREKQGVSHGERLVALPFG